MIALIASYVYMRRKVFRYIGQVYTSYNATRPTAPNAAHVFSFG